MDKPLKESGMRGVELAALLAAALSFGLSERALADDLYPVSTVAELKAALEDVTSKSSTKSTAVITLAEGTYDLSELSEPMYNVKPKALLSVESSHKRSLTIQGDPDKTRDKIVIDGKQLGRIWRVKWYSGGSFTVKNLTIRNALENTDNNGGGVFRLEGSASHYVTNCAFIGNSGGWRGGVIYRSAGSLYVYDSLFATNRVTDSGGGGGAIFAGDRVSGCQFVKNELAGNTQYGGALNGVATVTNCLFDSNAALGTGNYGGAIRMGGGGTIVDCVFTNNSGKYATIYLDTTSNVKIRKCQFYDAYHNLVNGAAVYCTKPENVTSTISDSYFRGNYADGNTNAGRGGAVASFYGLITNCTFVANKAQYGGAIYDCTNVRHCVFACNSTENAGTSGTEGGGAAYKCTLMDGCVVTNNTASPGAGGAFHSCKVFDSYMSGNTASTSAEEARDSVFDRCVFEGNGTENDNSMLYNCSISRSVVRGCTNHYCAAGTFFITNTLFLANKCGTFFRPAGACYVVNCSLVTNHYDMLTSQQTGGSIAYINNFFYGRVPITYTDRGDLDASSSTGLCYTNNYFYSSSSVSGSGNINTRINESFANPKLMGDRDPERPYAPSRKSCLVGAGLVMDWMADATDNDGNPRLSGAKVAIGAFESTDFYVPGLLLLFQ